MKRVLIASILVLGTSHAQAATYLGAIAGAAGSNLTLEDNSREQWVDVDGNGQINAGDRLEGFLRFDSFNPPAQGANNNLYVTFSQTFGTDFSGTSLGGGFTQYRGTFSSVTLNFLEGAFSQDWSTADLSGGVATAIAALTSEGTSAFKAGLVSADDFFAFQTGALEAGVTDYVQNPALTTSILSSNPLGNFGAGLSVYDININAIFERSITTTFLSGSTIYGAGKKYDLAVINGNFGGINDGVGTVQNMPNGFVDNADVVIHATIPEPGVISLLGLGLVSLGAAKRRMGA